jgi:hypothetical protein
MRTRQGLRKVPNFHTRRLCRELAELRRSSGLLQADLFEATQLEHGKISRFEGGQLPRYLELNALLDLYGVPSCDWKPYQDTWHAASTEWWDRQSLRDVLYIANEHEASVIRDVQLTYLPDLLQTEKYARQQLDTSEPPFSRTRLPIELAARMKRQELLDDDDSVELHALIYQPVLHARVDKAQLRLLLRRVAHPKITVQIVPRAEIPYGDLHCSFTLLSFPYKDEPDIGYVTGPFGMSQLEKTDQVGSLGRKFKSLLQRAMSPEESCAYIEKLTNQTHAALSGAR